jgi:DNA-binding XRE family transcriptional regulator
VSGDPGRSWQGGAIGDDHENAAGGGLGDASPATRPARPLNEIPPPALPGFREMAERREAAEREMASGRADLVRELAERRAAAGITQAEVAALMGTSQPAVARLEAGTGDLRASTLERYAAAVGARIDWKFST